ncbi:polysaccharide deacetylase family protein [Streptomyces sodiiphilus]|uniref:Polysaccharide deacetylase family protein n=1 Tax=Streptomyces sodiiphilus TaxID=226217 RepID=A0ABN2NRD4_9ACTN
MRISRRVLLGAAGCLGLVAVNRALLGPGDGPEGPDPVPPAGAPGQASPADTAAYRLRPFAGTGSVPSAPGRPPTAVRRAAAKTLPGPGRRIALTFDDGPHPRHTPEVLEILRRYNAPATFFVIGENAAWNPDLLRAIADDGHVVANHSWSHPQLNLISRARVREELGRTSEVIEKVLGEPPRWARAPYGVWDRASLTICAELAMEPLGWSIDTNDWTRPGSGAISSAVLEGAHSGGIVLAHDGGGDRGQTVQALRHYLPRLRDRGFALVARA